jgi:hypothetical protein
MQPAGRPGIAAALLRAMVSGRGQFPTFAAKYAKGSAILRTGDAEHKLGFPVASDPANYIGFKRRILKGHRIASQPMRRLSAEAFPERPVTNS